MGTAGIRTIVDKKVEHGQPRIIGVGLASPSGLRNGVVVNCGLATEAIGPSVNQAEKILGQEIISASAGIGSACASRIAVANVTWFTLASTDNLVRSVRAAVQQARRKLDWGIFAGFAHDERLLLLRSFVQIRENLKQVTGVE